MELPGVEHRIVLGWPRDEGRDGGGRAFRKGRGVAGETGTRRSPIHGRRRRTGKAEYKIRSSAPGNRVARAHHAGAGSWRPKITRTRRCRISRAMEPTPRTARPRAGEGARTTSGISDRGVAPEAAIDAVRERHGGGGPRSSARPRVGGREASGRTQRRDILTSSATPGINVTYESQYQERRTPSASRKSRWSQPSADHGGQTASTRSSTRKRSSSSPTPRRSTRSTTTSSSGSSTSRTRTCRSSRR